MFAMTIIYGKPRDADAFLKHYREMHAPLVAKVPGLQRATYGRCEHPMGGDRQADHFLVATLEFADRASYEAAMKTAEMAATGKDLKNFADGGVSMVAHEMVVVQG